MTNSYTILLVIPCLNEQDHIESLVNNMVKHTQNIGVQIIIADGGSRDNTISIAKDLENKYPNVTYMHNPKAIQSAAVNLAVKTYGADKEYLIRIDAHAKYPDNYCTSLIEEAKNNNASSVVVPLNTVGQAPVQIAIAAAQNSIFGNGGASHRNMQENGKWVDHGHHALISIDAFEDIGGYDETFSHNEDSELDRRLTNAGYKIWLTGLTSSDYYPRSDLVSLFKQYMNYGRGRIKTILKHKMLPKPRQIAPAIILPVFILSFLYFLSPIMVLPLFLWAMLCLGYGAYLGIKAKDKHTFFLSGLAIMVMHMGWSIGFWHGLILYTGNKNDKK